jgi:hypothetical protein
MEFCMIREGNGTVCAHRNADVSGRERWRIIDAVAHVDHLAKLCAVSLHLKENEILHLRNAKKAIAVLPF